MGPKVVEERKEGERGEVAPDERMLADPRSNGTPVDHLDTDRVRNRTVVPFGREGLQTKKMPQRTPEIRRKDQKVPSPGSGAPHGAAHQSTIAKPDPGRCPGLCCFVPAGTRFPSGSPSPEIGRGGWGVRAKAAAEIFCDTVAPQPRPRFPRRMLRTLLPSAAHAPSARRRPGGVACRGGGSRPSAR